MTVVFSPNRPQRLNKRNNVVPNYIVTNYTEDSKHSKFLDSDIKTTDLFSTSMRIDWLRFRSVLRARFHRSTRHRFVLWLVVCSRPRQRRGCKGLFSYSNYLGRDEIILRRRHARQFLENDSPKTKHSILCILKKSVLEHFLHNSNTVKLQIQRGRHMNILNHFWNITPSAEHIGYIEFT